ncbi:MAG: hypothetical protein GWO08_18685, partial [Gammaproteobacteria bacterium]|nr:hypothetical protein [Gammaproteobacteria bacterium]NIW50321.1 hypothetical protein [Gammaproteobacteria bacterium]
THSTSRVNLYIFLTPRIIRNPGEAFDVTKEKSDSAVYHHEIEPGAGIFQYRQETREILRERHTPSPYKEEEQPEEGLRIEEPKQ